VSARSDRARTVWVGLGLVAVVLLAYGQVLDHDFISHDDGAYLTENPMVVRGLSGEGLAWSLSTFTMGNWHPLTWLSHMLDCELFGLEPGPHHLVSALLHAASAVLLFLALGRLGGSGASPWPSAFVAAAFALHPLHVESVAWAAERKDVLSGLFWMLTLWAYARYAERPAARRYALVVASFALGLLAKPMLVTLPFVLLLLDAWPLGRWRPLEDGFPSKLLLEKIPLLSLAAASSAVTVVAQRSVAAMGTLEALSPAARIENAAISYAIYLGKTLWPTGLSFFYPHPRLAEGDVVSPGAALAAGILLLAITAAVLAGWRRRPWLAVGWFWFAGTLVPVIGLMQVGMQARADRYTYLPSIGLFVALAWTAREVAARGTRVRRLVTAAGALSLAACLATTWVQVGHWRDSRSLAEHALRVNEENHLAWTTLGWTRHREGDRPGAETAFRRALDLKPDSSTSLIGLAEVRTRQGRYDEAETLFTLALRVDPTRPGPHHALGGLLERKGDLDGAVRHLRQAVALRPDLVESRFKLAAVHAARGELGEAAREFERVLEFAPGFAEAHYNLGAVRAAMGETEAAIRHLERALDLDPDYELARRALETLR